MGELFFVNLRKMFVNLRILFVNLRIGEGCALKMCDFVLAGLLDQIAPLDQVCEGQPDVAGLGLQRLGDVGAGHGSLGVAEEDIGLELPAVEGAQYAPLNLEYAGFGDQG